MSSEMCVKKAAAVVLGLLLTISGGQVTIAMPEADSMQSPPPRDTVQVNEPDTAPGEMLVKFKELKIPDALPQAGKLNALRSMLSAAADRALADLRAEVISASPLSGILLISFDSKTSVSEAIKLLEETGAVEYAEPNYRVQMGQAGIKATASQPDLVSSSQPASRLGAVTRLRSSPTDPSFPQQWSLNNTGQTGGEADADIDALEAWGTATDASNTIVGVLGTGIYYDHGDLKANMWKNPGETSCTDGIDNDTNGYIDDCYGIDAYLNSGDPLDDNGLGTHAAGIIGAVGNNGIGIAGVAWKARLMGLRYLDAEGWGWTADAVQCIDYAIKIKVKNVYPRMVLLSEQVSYPYSKAMYDILGVAQSNGILVVTGSRPDNTPQDVWPAYPASYERDNIITVGGSDSRDNRVGWGYGRVSVDLVAPGTDILSTWPANTYKLVSGPTQAAAHVAGAAALAWTKYPTLNWKQIKGMILNSVDNGLHNYGWDTSMTIGRLNLNTGIASTARYIPAVFAITPPVTEVGQNVTLAGINFGTSATGGSVLDAYCSAAYPASSIVSWTNEKIVVKVPQACKWGDGLLKVSRGVPSRGAMFRVNKNEYGVNWWIDPTYQGATILQHRQAASAQIGTDLWIIGGQGNYSDLPTGDVERFSLATMRGEVRPDWEMPMPVRAAGAAAIGTKIYVVGGYDDNTKRQVAALQIFDTVTGAWTRGRNVPQPLDSPSVVNVNNLLWVMGGSAPNNMGLKTNYLYNPSTNTWQTKQAMPLKRSYAGVATPITGQIWLVSGYTENGGSWSVTNDVAVYNIATNTWDIRDDIRLNGAHAAGGVINIGSKVFALYGDNDWGAGEWLSKPQEGAGVSWYRNISRTSGLGDYTPMLGKIGTTVYVISGNRARNVYKFVSP